MPEAAGPWLSSCEVLHEARAIVPTRGHVGRRGRAHAAKSSSPASLACREFRWAASGDRPARRQWDRLGRAALPLDGGQDRRAVAHFFSRLAARAVLRDAGITTWWRPERALAWRLCSASASRNLEAAPSINSPPATGAGMVVYTSGSTGRPKGVRLGHRADRLAGRRPCRRPSTPPRTILICRFCPLALLLETITSIYVPVLVGASTHFASAVAESIGPWPARRYGRAFEAARPTTAVLVPQLLSVWVAQLEMRKTRAPKSCVSSPSAAPASPKL